MLLPLRRRHAVSVHSQTFVFCFFFFQASAIGVFGAVPDPILGGGMSRIVGDSEQGNEFIIRSTDLS